MSDDAAMKPVVLKRVEGGYRYEPLKLFIYREPAAPSHEWVVATEGGGALYAPSLKGVRDFIVGLEAADRRGSE